MKPDHQLRRLAKRAGLLVRWQDWQGRPREVAPGTLREVLEALDFPCASKAQIRESLKTVKGSRKESRTGRSRAWSVAQAAGSGRHRGLVAQLYSLRRQTPSAFGSYVALAELAENAARAGYAAVGVSPVHAPRLADARRHAPYSPSSRLFYNPLYVDVPEAARELGIEWRVTRKTSGNLIDWARAGPAQVEALRRLFERAPRPRGYAAWRRERGPALTAHARFEALHAHFSAQGQPDWRQWPSGFSRADSAEVVAFARRHRRDIEFHEFCQWLAERQLAQAQARARTTGLSIGLIHDLAVGTDPGGSHAWSSREDLFSNLTIGAPPDALNAQGQDWGLTTYSPRALERQRDRPFAELLQATLRHAGGLRIDHVLGLNRLWMIPRGARPDQGVYLKFPLQRLLGVVARESRRARAPIIGEDLGTVPPELAARLAKAGLLGLRVLLFMRDRRGFIDAKSWPRHAVAMPTTHDTPTLAGWWQGRDLDWLETLGVAGRGARARRKAERRDLWRAFCDAGAAQGSPPTAPRPFVEAALRFIARAPSALSLVPLEDLLALEEQPNLPGTVDEHPNWRRRMPEFPILQTWKTSIRC